MGRRNTKTIISGLLADGVPRGIHQIHLETSLPKRAVEGACYRAWRDGDFLRSSEPGYGKLSQFRGRAGIVTTNRGFYLYLFRGDGQNSARVGSVEYVPYGEEFLSNKIPKGESKSKRILRFLKENPQRAWYSTEIVESLKDAGVRPTNVMPAVSARANSEMMQSKKRFRELKTRYLKMLEVMLLASESEQLEIKYSLLPKAVS